MPLHPPGAVDPDRFEALCDGCGECARACPQNIVSLRSGRPDLDFSRAECTLCGYCSSACPTGALNPQRPLRLGFTATIGPRCLTVGGVECRLCGDYCGTRAIRFLPVRGGIRLPTIEPGLCNGCGACVRPCPAGAIEFTPTEDAIP